ncbi:SPOR domain-containing protein [Legionella nagasakiensis]|uniref:SPOR domain-containing protein n=1 Tax=Legionella nagasakiensis TaxID=535290 RepID=UPI001054C479|nr:SPOR domain-containing protein [Legionella nagasakiensis]
MKVVLDERRKHRLVGVVVILSITIVFLPAILKKSNEHLDERINLSVRLPAKPSLPDVVKSEEKSMFQSIKVAHVDITEVRELAPPVHSVKAEPLSKITAIDLRKNLPTNIAANQADMMAKQANIKDSALQQTTEKKMVEEGNKKTVKLATQSKENLTLSGTNSKNTYSVQIGYFSVKSNAVSLVSKLRNKGYKASYTKSSNQKGDFYKVMVGEVSHKEEAKNLQKQLAEQIQLNGFVVKTGVS